MAGLFHDFPPLHGEGQPCAAGQGGEAERLRGVSGLGAQRRSDRVHHAIHVLSHRSVPEAEHREAFTLQDLVPDEVVISLWAVGVLPAIDLDNKPAAEADEVEVVAEEWSLAPEVVSFRP